MTNYEGHCGNDRRRHGHAARLLVILLALGAAGAAHGGALLHACRIVNGQIAGCDGMGYQGTTVLPTGNGYRSCEVVHGNVSGCGGWYQGSAPAVKDRAYHLCNFITGRIASCSPALYMGTVVQH